MRNFGKMVLCKKFALIFFIMISAMDCGFSQEKEEGVALVESLNVVINEIGKPKFEKTPTISIMSSSSGLEDSELSYKYYDSVDEWMIFTFRYSVDDWTNEGEAKPTREERKLNPIIPEITFKVYIEGISKGKKKEETSVLLTGEATYVNIKKTNSSVKYRYGAFFVPPEAVELYDLKTLHNAGKGNIRIEAYIGEKKAVKGKNLDESYKDLKEKDETWETAFKGMNLKPNFVFTKEQTPWVLSSLDRFPMLKPKGSDKK